MGSSQDLRPLFAVVQVAYDGGLRGRLSADRPIQPRHYPAGQIGVIPRGASFGTRRGEPGWCVERSEQLVISEVSGVMGGAVNVSAALQ